MSSTVLGPGETPVLKTRQTDMVLVLRGLVA